MNESQMSGCVNCNLPFEDAGHRMSPEMFKSLRSQSSPESSCSILETFQSVFRVSSGSIKNSVLDDSTEESESKKNRMCMICTNLLESSYQMRSMFLKRSNPDQRVHQFLKASGNHDGIEQVLDSGSDRKRLKLRNCVVVMNRVPNLSVVNLEMEKAEESERNCQNDQGKFVNNKNNETKDLNCSLCSRTFKWRAFFLVHLQEDHADVNREPTMPANTGKRFHCAVCSYKCAARVHLEWHYCVHHTYEKPYVCDRDYENCSYSCVTAQQLNFHIRSHHSSKPKPTDGPRKRESTPTNEQQHFERDKRYKCDKCPKVLPTSEILAEHVESHRNDEPEPELQLAKMDEDEVLFVTVKQEQEPEIEYVYDCDNLDDDVEISGIHTKEGVQITESTSEPPYTCSECNESFKWEGLLLYHQTMKHTKIIPVPTKRAKSCCIIPGCAFTYSQREQFKFHIFTHTKETLRCNFEACNYFSRSYQLLLKHEKIVHGKSQSRGKSRTIVEKQARFDKACHQTAYNCQDCVQGFSWKADLLVHNQLTHSPKPLTNGKYSCVIASCDYNTKFKQLLMSHVYGHTGEKPFKCPYKNCWFAGTSNMSMKQHISWRHKRRGNFKNNLRCGSNIKEVKQSLSHVVQAGSSESSVQMNFKCKTCSKTFEFQAQLLYHEHVHHHPSEGSWSGNCKLCSYKSMNRTLFALHMFKHTKEKPFKCVYPSCSFGTARKYSYQRHLEIHSKLQDNSQINDDSTSPSALMVPLTPPTIVSTPIGNPPSRPISVFLNAEVIRANRQNRDCDSNDDDVTTTLITLADGSTHTLADLKATLTNVNNQVEVVTDPVE